MRNAIMAGERVYLRPLEVGDAETLSRFDAEEPDTFMYRGREPISQLAGELWLKKAYATTPPPYIPFAVCLRADDQLIGTMGLHDLEWINGVAETGSFLGHPFRNQGYGPEGKHLILEYAFERLHLHLILSTVFETNTRSVAALAKQGYRPAGRLPWFDVKDGVYRDMLMFDLLRDEWLAAREAWRSSLVALAR